VPRRWVVGLVVWCWKHARLVVAGAVLTSVALAAYAGSHLQLDTDQSHMISADLPFRKTEQRLDAAFPQDVDLLVMVVDAPTAERADHAVDLLQQRLAPRTDLFRSLRRPPEEAFFQNHALLFLSTDDLTELSDRLSAAQPMLGELARDPSLRGLLATADLAIDAAQRGALDKAGLDAILDRLDGAATAIAAHKPVPPSSWQSLLGTFGDHDFSRRVLLSQPVLHYGELVAGGEASAAIRAAARDLGEGVRVRLTGPVALSDANFATVTAGAKISVPLILLAICGLLFWAVRSLQAMVAVLVTMTVGLVATGAFAALAVGTLNPISVAFAVMFVGIAVDFGIQFMVRHEDERSREPDMLAALRNTAGHMAAPLSLAAAATAVGFLSFLPTDYTGVSQLGLIAGAGMVIALLADFTVLPALLALLPAPARTAPLGLKWAAGDRWLVEHCRMVLVVAALLAVAGLALLPRLPVDFDPLNLQDPKTEAVATFRDLGRNPDYGVYALDILAASAEEAASLTRRFDGLPDVLRTESFAMFVPDDQDDKRAIIGDLAQLLGPTLSPATLRTAPSLDELSAALHATAGRIGALPRADAAQRSSRLRKVADSGSADVLAMQNALMEGLPELLDNLRKLLNTAPVTFDDIPPEVRRQWISADGKWRVKVLPKGDMENHDRQTHFAHLVESIDPNAAGEPISIEKSGHVVSVAFAKAGGTAIVAIGLLLWLMLRRVRDAALVVLPLVLGALFTVIGCVVTGIAINFANIIALPLLLGVGVAFNIYFVVNWRVGLTEHLQSATCRAVLFSALTTGSAFGSLAVSPHLGTASMGLLLFLSLGLSVLTTFLVLPALFAFLDRRRS
jgi:hopanoid biosynthesis associated RND transporter like protein HpnN